MGVVPRLGAAVGRPEEEFGRELVDDWILLLEVVWVPLIQKRCNRLTIKSQDVDKIVLVELQESLKENLYTFLLLYKANDIDLRSASIDALEE